MDKTIEIKEIESVRVAYLKYSGEIMEANKVFPTVFKAIKGKSSGAPFFCYYQINTETKVGDMELCVPTEEESNTAGVQIKQQPRIRALCFIHKGSYATMKESYQLIVNYASEQKIVLGAPVRELFIKGPGMFLKGNPATYITEIQYPIVEMGNEK